MREHHKDFERCKACGGTCCRVYLSCREGGLRPIGTLFDEWIEDWEVEFEACGASEFKPLFDPLEVHMGGNEHMLADLEKQGLDPYKCKYCDIDGCLLPWDKKPNACKEYRCYKWRQEDKLLDKVTT